MVTQNLKEKTDIVIIGAGPVGLFSVFEAGMLKMKCHIVDPLDAIGGQCQALYPEKPIYDIPAYPEITAIELIEKLHEQIKPFAPKFHLNNKVIKLDKLGEGWLVTTNHNIQIECKAIIIAAGCGAFGPHKPPLENLELFENTKSVQYYVKKIADFKDKKVAIAGGGDSAIDWALSLSEVASKVSLIHRRDKFRAAPNSVEKMRDLVAQGKIDLVTPYQLQGLEGENGNLKYVKVSDLDGNIKHVDAEILLPFYGLSMELGEITQWGLNLEKKHIQVEASTMKTNVERIFAIGDIINYPGKLKLILTGFSEAALAAHNIYKYVYPETPLHFEYSTSKGLK
jgi:thioredoxin reductase (NADPH)